MKVNAMILTVVMMKNTITRRRQARTNLLNLLQSHHVSIRCLTIGFPLVSYLLWSMVHLRTQMIDWRALKSVMGKPILTEEGLKKENVKLVRKRMIDRMTILTQEDMQLIKCLQVRLYDCGGWLMNTLQTNQIAWSL